MRQPPDIPVQCPLCGGDGIRYRFTKQDIPHYSCTSCAFVFSRPAINPNLANAIKDYEPAYLDYFKEKSHDIKNHAALEHLLRKHISLSDTRILDVGCGSGRFVHYLRNRGYEASGLEPSKALYDAFLQGDHFFNDNLSGFIDRHPHQRFDVIIVADVLEHIEEPGSFIKDICSLLSPGGVVFISTPDTGSVFAKWAGRRWHYYNKYHLSLFNGENLISVFGRHSLSRIDSGKVTRHQSVYYIIQYLLNFIMHRKGSAPAFLKRMIIPVNLLDNMYVIFKKENGQEDH